MKNIVTIGIACALAAIALATPAAAQPAQPAPKGITTYRETIDLAAGGSALVTVDVTLAGWQDGVLDLPLNVANPEELKVVATGMAATIAAVRVGDVRMLRVTFGQLPAATQTLTLTYATKTFLNWERSRSPRGFHALSYTFANVTTATVADYGLTVVLPTGYLVRGITSSTPRATGEEIEPPYGFATRNGRVQLSLRAKPVTPGRFAAIAFGFEPAGHSPLPVLVIAGLIALAGLYLKRDVLTRATFEAKIAG